LADSEKKIRQEDCSEDTFGPGILTVTNKRIAFDKTRGRILDFSKKFDDTVIDVSLNDVVKETKERFFQILEEFIDLQTEKEYIQEKLHDIM